MIDPSFDTATPTMESVDNFLTRNELESKVADLENKLSLKTQSWEHVSTQLQQRVAQIESFENELKANPWDFDGETLNDLARFFDITLEREYMVEVTVKFSGSVTVPMDYDIDDLENDLNAELTQSYYANSSVTVDFMEEDMEISYEEI
jgi:hypothetical protein